MLNKTENEFCMSQFKPAIAVIAVLVVLILGWMIQDCVTRSRPLNYSLVAATGPMGPPIRVKDKMLHPYWGNCNKCHLTTDAGKPVSKVMTGPPISVNMKMTHEYWGNCLLCHKVTDGVQPNQTMAKAAAATRITAQSLGLKTQTVTAAMMKQFGLPNEDGVLVLEVTPLSIAGTAGLQKGDEIIRAGKVRTETVANLDSALADFKPGTNVQLNIYRGNKSRNIYVKLPDNLVQAAATVPMTQDQIELLAEPDPQGRVVAATAPMTQNQVETLAEQLGVPKTQQAVTQALQQQKNQARPAAANVYYGKVAVASTGPGPGYMVAPLFGANRYFIVIDPAANTYSVVNNPAASGMANSDILAGQSMVDLGVSQVVAGSFTPSAQQTLRNLRITVYPGVAGSVQDVIGAYMAGSLVPGNTAPAAMPGGSQMGQTANGNLNQQVIF